MNIKYIKESLEPIVLKSFTWQQLIESLGLKFGGGTIQHLKNVLKKFNIPFSHFLGSGHNKGKVLTDIKDYLNNSKRISSHSLKLKLIKENYKEHRCECCNNSEWLGEPIAIELHHIDGNHTNNQLENLKILCPNCHAKTENYKGKNSKGRTLSSPSIPDEIILTKIPLFKNKRQLLNDLGLSSKGGNYKRISKLLSENPNIRFKIQEIPRLNLIPPLKEKQKKIIWPSPEEIKVMIWKESTAKVAKTLGVSDKAIEKFCKKHNVPKPPRGYWAKNNKPM